jgi:hypothetical protein
VTSTAHNRPSPRTWSQAKTAPPVRSLSKAGRAPVQPLTCCRLRSGIWIRPWTPLIALKNVLTWARSRSHRGLSTTRKFPVIRKLAAPLSTRQRKRVPCNNWPDVSGRSLFLGCRLSIPRVKIINPLLPHRHKCARGEFTNRFPDTLNGRKRVPPDRPLAPFFPFFSTLVGSAHRFPGNLLRIVDVFRRSLHSLLMYQIDIAQARLLMGIQLKQLLPRREACKRQQRYCREDQ